MAGQLSTGSTVAGFVLEALIGEGATGSVYRARSPGHARVALKVLAPELARDERYRQRFLRESRLAAGLDHPHVVPVLAAGEDDGVLYLAMRYVDGPDLREVLRRQLRLEPELALSLVSQVASALDAAHHAGLVHRDVKPANILVDDEHVYVCDFGLARHVSSVSSLTTDRGFVGTIDYIPPEQIEGGKIDRRADVYSLGCVLFECLAGARLFERESDLATVFAHLNEPPPPLTDARPELPAELDEVFATALAKSPDDRYQSCGELVAATQAAFEGRTFVRRRRRRTRLLAACAALVVAVGGAVGAVLATSSARAHITSPRTASRVTLRPNALNLVSSVTHAVVGRVGLGPNASSAGTPPDVISAGRSAWVLLVPNQRLLRIGLRTHRVERTVKLPWVPTGRIAVGGGLVWARQDGGPGVIGVRERSGSIARRFAVSGGNSIGIAYGSGALWLAQGDDVAQVDPSSGRVLHRIVERPGEAGNTDWLAFAAGSLWSADASNGIVRKYDPVASQVVAHIQLHGWISDLAIGGGDVWVSVEQDGVLYRLNEDDLSVQGTEPAGVDPQRISIGGRTVWTADDAGDALSGVAMLTGARRELNSSARPQTATYVGGLLLAVASPVPRPLPPINGEEIRIAEPYTLQRDPATPTSALDDEIAYATCSGLLAYRDAPGRRGATLRPEVAAALPTVSRDGRTYTFRVRRGFRFSPPSNQPVTAATFKYSIERALSKPFDAFGAGTVGDIAGEHSYLTGAATHVSGIVARGDRLRITLVAPSGDFLTRLADPSFCPVPHPTQIRPESVTAPIPRDGPYYVASQTSDRTVLLRNPNYGGNRARRPARIVFETVLSEPEAVALADGGQADYVPASEYGGPLLGTGGVLDRRYGPGSAAARSGDERYLHRPTAGEDGVVLNASQPLFRSLRMRRAVAYALDRTALARSYGDLPSDELVPPSVPDFGPADVFSLHADLARARRLAGPGRRRAVLYYCTNGVFGGSAHARVAAVIRAELARIGILVTITAPPCSPDGSYDLHSRRADLILTSFFGLRDPEFYISAILSPSTIGGALGRGLWSEPRFVARVRRAGALAGSARTTAYRRIQAELLRAAPIVMFGSWYDGEYFSPRVGCRTIPPGPDVVDLTTLCKK